MRKAGTDDHHGDGDGGLAVLVDAGIDGGKLLGARLLQFVYEDENPDPKVARRLTEGLEESRQILGKSTSKPIA